MEGCGGVAFNAMQRMLFASKIPRTREGDSPVFVLQADAALYWATSGLLSNLLSTDVRWKPDGSQSGVLRVPVPPL